MNILILNGSPRPNGNTAAMVKAFAEGAEAAGHIVNVVPVGSMKIGGCLGCEYCHNQGSGRCIQQDDENKVYDALKDAEMLVLASPIYYYTLTAQMQAAIHRTYAIGIPDKVRCSALLLSSGAPNVYEPAIQQYKLAIVEYFGVEDLGVMTVNEDDNRVEDNLDALRDFGRNIPVTVDA